VLSARSHVRTRKGAAQHRLLDFAERHGYTGGGSGQVFLSFAVESFGGLGKETLKLSDMVALEELSLGASARMTKRQFHSWLAVDWQRNNAATCIANAWCRLVRRRL
jgi:hypothetical protein